MTNFIVGRLKLTGDPFLKMNFDKSYNPATHFLSWTIYTNKKHALAKLEVLKHTT